MEEITDDISYNGEVQSKSPTTAPIPHVHQSTTTTMGIPTNISEQKRSPTEISGIRQLSSSPEKRKRGWPKKYGSCPRGTLILRPPVIATAARVAASVLGNVTPPPKRGRGRPKGSTRRSEGDSQGFFSIERIDIQAGEDIAAKLTSYAKNTSKAILILTAFGSVSSVVFHHPFSSRGLIKHEGNFEIVKLNGSFCMDNTGRRTGKLSVTLLSESDHRMFGGAVGGPLLAALPVEIMIGSFAQDTRKSTEPSTSTRRFTMEETHSPVPLRVVTLVQYDGFRFQRRIETTPPPFESEASMAEPENPNSAFVSDLPSSPETLDDLPLPPVPTSVQIKDSDGKI